MTLHEPVLLKEALEGLAIQPSGVYVDATFGRGGHTRALLARLSQQGRVIAMDQDPEAVAYAKDHFSQDERFFIVHRSFAGLETTLIERGVQGKVNGILFDLGVSSPQLDNPTRGFSFRQAGPLDMRMNPEKGLDAATFINTASETQLSEVFYHYGEERFARRIAKALVLARQEAPFVSTEQLAAVVAQANPKWEKHKHPATRVFQAIRLHINQELEALSQGLEAAMKGLATGGRLVVISFHSLEDRLVKQFMKRQAEGEPLPKYIPLRASHQTITLKRIGRAVKPSVLEVTRNVRARSAVMRIGEKLT